EVVGGVPAGVSADDDSYARLRSDGLARRRWVKLGPTSAIEARSEDGPVYDPGRWRVEEDNGELMVSNVVPRLTTANRLLTGVRGRVVEEGRVSVSGSA